MAHTTNHTDTFIEVRDSEEYAALAADPALEHRRAMRSRGLREKDGADFDATLPFLDERRRRWLADALQRTLPQHPWLSRLG